jgi:hypothetical protein
MYAYRIKMKCEAKCTCDALVSYVYVYVRQACKHLLNHLIQVVNEILIHT